MRKFRTLRIPNGCDPLVRRMTKEQNAQRIGDHDLAERTGLSPSAFKAWRSRRSPAVQNITAALNALGYKLVPFPIKRKDWQNRIDVVREENVKLRAEVKNLAQRNRFLEDVNKRLQTEVTTLRHHEESAPSGWSYRG